MVYKVANSFIFSTGTYAGIGKVCQVIYAMVGISVESGEKSLG